MANLQQARTCLHLVASKSASALEDCMNCRCEGDSVVLIDSGVMHLVSGNPEEKQIITPGLHFSREDLEARGLLSVARNQGVEILDDRAVAALLRKHEHCLTWK